MKRSMNMIDYVEIFEEVFVNTLGLTALGCLGYVFYMIVSFQF